MAAEPEAVAGRRARGRSCRRARGRRRTGTPGRGRHLAADLADLRARYDRDPGRTSSRFRAIDPGCRVRCGPDRRAAVAGPTPMAWRRNAVSWPALPQSSADPDRRRRSAVGRIGSGSRRSSGRARSTCGRRRPAVPQLRAVTLRYRPVLPALWNPPGRLSQTGPPTRRGRAPRPPHRAAPGR